MEETALEIQRKEIQVVSLRSGYAQETIQKAIVSENAGCIKTQIVINVFF